VFVDRPAALIEVFYHYQQNPQIHGIRANTLRFINQSLYLIDDEFRKDEGIKAMFLSIFKHHNLVFKQLKLMNALGVLGAYLPVFGRIVGRMQYDLFHMYTVDQHTLFVLRNIRQIFITGVKHPHPHEVAQRLKQHYVLNLAGFFHDIAKGRGGDHAELGAYEAQQFADDFNLPVEDTELLVWLVKQHLIMSVVAQKQDISDAHVIAKFAKLMVKQDYLDHLYILTVADISGTDPKLWNSYKDSLLQELYLRTSQYLAQEHEDWVANSKAEALDMLDEKHHDEITDLWQYFPDRFFDYSSVEQIAKISQAIAENNHQPTVCFTDLHQDGFEIMLYGNDKLGLFHQVVEVFADFQINVANARIYTGTNEHVLDYFHCLCDYNDGLLNRLKQAMLKVLLQEEYKTKKRVMVVSRREKLFLSPPNLSFGQGRTELETRFEIKCSDYAGLLANITQIFVDLNIDIHAAKIATFGHRAEDVFWLSQNNKSLDKLTQQNIEKAFDALLNRV
jgi:[protein-PII] uridylyltransferase